MTSVIGAHIINGAGRWLNDLRRLQPSMVLVLDPNRDDIAALRAACPNTVIVGRIYQDDSLISGKIKENPEAAAQWAHSLALQNSAVAAGLVDYVQFANEVCQFWDELPLLSRFEIARMKIAKGFYKCAIFGFSVGNPDLPEHDRLALWRQVYPAIAFAETNGHVISLHQYGAPNLWGPDSKGGAPWLINRLEVQVLPVLPYKKIKFVVTEFGIDGLLLDPSVRSISDDPGTGVITPVKKLNEKGESRSFYEPAGWQRYTSASDYVRQLLDMSSWLKQFSARIVGYATFTLGNNPPWGSYDIGGDVLRLLADSQEGVREIMPITEGDPRAANCRGYHLDANGKVDGINLVWEPIPSARYACISAQLITEANAQNNRVVTVEVFNKDGIRTAENAVMMWPYGEPEAEDSPAGPGNPNNQFTTDSTYPSAGGRVGPLGFEIIDASGKVISDKIWGYGLPDNRHICGYVAFKERSEPVVVPPPTPSGPLPENEPVASVGTLIEKCRWYMEESVRQDEVGNHAYAEAIRYSLIKLNNIGLLYRLENAIKLGRPTG